MKHAFYNFILACILAVSAPVFADDTGNNGTGVADSAASADPQVPTPISGTLDTGSDPNKYQYDQMMEKCHVVDQDGNGLIKAYMADSGINLEGDASAWIWVPHGQCAKINAGDFSGVSPAIRAKINPSNIQNAPTLE